MANYHNNHQNSHNKYAAHNTHMSHSSQHNHGFHNARGYHKEPNKEGQANSSFVLGTKELEGKSAEFQYDKGWYSITDITGEEKNLIYKSRNAQEAYTKWNVYIGRKKERLQRTEKIE